MANKDELARLLAPLRDTPSFWHYVKTLEVRRDSAIHQVLYEQNPVNVEVLRGRARALDEQIKELYIALKPNG